MATHELLEWTATEAINHIHSGSITAERYASQLLKRYRESKALNAITWIDENRVLERARTVDAARSKGQTLGAAGRAATRVQRQHKYRGLSNNGGDGGSEGILSSKRRGSR
jgi:hypothetical protein